MPRKRLSTAWRKPLSAALRAFDNARRAQLRAATASLRLASKATKRTKSATRIVARAPSTSPSPAPSTHRATVWAEGVALGPGGVRRHRLFVPAGIAPAGGWPLLVMLHGCGQDAEAFAFGTRIAPLAARERFAVLCPQQDRGANLQGCWNWFDTDTGRAQREAATLLAGIDQVVRLHAIDPARVAVAGLSAGAGMAALLASRYPARFAAVVMHSGVAPGAAHSTASAWRAMLGGAGEALSVAADAATPWPPLLVIHGTGDRVVVPVNGRAAAQAWADAAGARPAVERLVRRGQRRPAAVTDYRHRGRVVATLCLVEGLGHAWSGGRAGQPFCDPTGPDASRMVWAFASRQFARRGISR